MTLQTGDICEHSGSETVVVLTECHHDQVTYKAMVVRPDRDGYFALGEVLDPVWERNLTKVRWAVIREVEVKVSGEGAPTTLRGLVDHVQDQLRKARDRG